MSFLHESGKVLGKAGGWVLGKPIQFVGKATGKKFIEDVGTGVIRSTMMTGDLVGQAVSGGVSALSGLINEDQEKKEAGLQQLFQSGKRTADVFVQSGKGIYSSGKDIVEGVKNNDSDQWKKGATHIAKGVVIGAVAIGVTDFLIPMESAEAEVVDINEEASMPLDQGSQAIYVTDSEVIGTTVNEVPIIHTINDHYAGETHLESGVSYEAKDVDLPSGTLHGVFPDFEEVYKGELPESMYLESDHAHIAYMSEQLYSEIQANPSLASQFTDTQISQIQLGVTPEGYTWHHSEEAGEMQLVDKETHDAARHTGGRELWGGGSENR